ncbi:MAG: hypothetical protein WHS87_07900 [Anaerolineales bacterium]
MDKTRTLFSIILACTLLLLLAACSDDGTPVDFLEQLPPTATPVPPTATPGMEPAQVADQNGEARIRYIMADIQLSGLDEYYRGFPDDPFAAEAIARWDRGIRVVNIDKFERKLVNGQWTITYARTDTPVNGMDIRLSSDDDSEARIRYIMADIQLSGLDGYYRGFPDDPLAAEAIARWDRGIRVVNIEEFERRLLPGLGWVIVYRGTEKVANGMDIILSDMSSGCNNPYWPVKVGATWAYEILNMMGNSEGTETWEITSVSNEPEGVRFTVHKTSPFGSGDSTYLCTPDGAIHQEDSNMLDILLPPVDEFVPRKTWPGKSGSSLLFVGMEQQSVPAGTFTTARFTLLPNGYTNYYWAEGVGLVAGMGDLSRVLKSYTIPAGSEIAPQTTSTPSTSSAAPTPGTGFCNNPYFPDQVGIQWVYRDEVGTYTVTVTSIENNRYFISNSRYGEQSSFICASDGSIYGEHDMPHTLQTFPAIRDLYVRNTWSGTTSPGPYEHEVTFTVDGFETVQVPAGRFETVVIHVYHASTMEFEEYYYYAQGIGIVKYVIIGDGGAHETVLEQFIVP